VQRLLRLMSSLTRPIPPRTLAAAAVAAGSSGTICSCSRRDDDDVVHEAALVRQRLLEDVQRVVVDRRVAVEARHPGGLAHGRVIS
jgi:hypothetical protein